MFTEVNSSKGEKKAAGAGETSPRAGLDSARPVCPDDPAACRQTRRAGRLPAGRLAGDRGGRRGAGRAPLPVRVVPGRHAPGQCGSDGRGGGGDGVLQGSE